MKNSKVTKVLVLVFSLVLLVGSAIGLSVSAQEGEETYTYEIPMINISHGASSSMLFAVDAPIEDAAAGNVVVTYSYYLGAEKIDAVATYSAEITESANIGMPVFYTVGISPKDQGEEITVEAHKASAPDDFEARYYTTTIGKYLYAKLYRDGFIYSDNANEKKLAKMYLAQIEYVSTAQDALWNADNPGAQRTLLNSYKYVAVKDGMIASTENSHDLISGDSVTVVYTGNDAVPSGWNVTTYDAEGKATTVNVIGNKITLTASAVLTPYIDPDMISFESFEVGNLPLDSDNKVTYTQNGQRRLWGNTTGEIAKVVDYNGNKGIDVTGNLWLYSKNYNDETHNVSLLQMDVICNEMNTSGNGASEKLSFRVGGSAFVLCVEWRYYPYLDGFALKVTNAQTGANAATYCDWVVIAKGVTSTSFNLKIEYLWSTGAVKVTVDDHVYYNGIIDVSGTKVDRVNYESQASNPSVIIDNIKQNTIYADPADFKGR